MKFEILDAATGEGRATWLKVWQAWPGQEVMALPDYVSLFARPCDRVVCVAGEDDGGGVLFPLLLRPLAAEPWARPGEARWDSVTPYGYGGPFAWGATRDKTLFWSAFSDWCRDERVVSTFARLSLFPDQLASIPGLVEVRGSNVVIPVHEGAEALWRGYESKVRKWVQHAERSGLSTEVDAGGRRLDAFVRVYYHTMERQQATSWYLFPRSFFQVIVDRMGGHYAFFHTLSGRDVVSSDLVLCSRDRIYYFLGGTLAEAFPLGPNYLLKHRIASWAIAEGKSFYVLGGGHVEGDGLFRYKRAFARRGVVPFRVACLQHDPGACRELAVDRSAFAEREGQSWLPRPGFFPPYRA